MDRNTTLVGYPDELPRRQRVKPPKFPNWTDPAQMRNWLFRPVPVVSLDDVHFSRDLNTVQRVYECMLAQGWGGSRHAG